MTEHDLTESVSPAGFIELMLSNALANGQSAVSARLIDFRESAKSTTFELGSDVKVAIAYRQGPRDTELPTSQQVVQDDAAACMPSRLPTGL